jgi:hypothetical protein
LKSFVSHSGGNVADVGELASMFLG